MCRHLAYLGPAVTLQALVVDPPYSLQQQSWAPRQQCHGRMNVDGFGVGWYAGSRPEPARYRRAQPIWTDRSFASLAGVVTSTCVLGAVRSATSGFPVEESATAPFTRGPWLFSHNGRVDGFRTGAAAELARALPRQEVAQVESVVDSALLFALAAFRLAAGAPIGEALAGVVDDVLAVTTGRLNLLATDGSRLAATACGDTLWTHAGADAVVVASEPYDDDAGWEQVPAGSLVTADLTAGVTVTPLDRAVAAGP